ncbi:protein phosphatase 2C, putative [Talaromyces stipitatus ATCC 10500]|uniref:Protein phosphatase 2C, putative n=1 Tax=Talaromyces stipitatus (strain ATCC 10500 / CBS 375.48 / QM 6759 / NRRL 1006) TaxID=441959 RepID=B8M1Y7_TALSN|nr:protein phosphatase 2C, putative [Talaromyces stipitatus ATCC 10500]EED21365.1 protein phosphatase 2C, putative [Talaromyces stipitatus ATCC 10500]
MSLEQDLASAEQELASLKESLAAKEQGDEAVQKEIKLRDDQIKSHNKQIKWRDDQIKSHKEQIKLRDDQIKLQEEQIKWQDEKIKTLHAQMSGLKLRLDRQNATIKNQSRTIQDPRSLRQRRMEETQVAQAPPTQPWVTPTQGAQSVVGPMQSLSLGETQQYAANYVDNTQYFQPQGQPGYVEHPGSQTTYQMSYPMESTNSYTGNQYGWNGTMAGSQSQGIFQPTGPIAAPSPMNTTLQSALYQAAFAPPAQSRVPSANDGYAGIEFESKAAAFGGRFHSLWAKVDQFARTYVVDTDLDPEELSVALKELMMLDPDAAVAVQYLNHPVIKHCYLSKVVSLYLCKKFLRYTEIVKRFHPNIDADIFHLRKQLTLDNPQGVRSVALTKLAQEISLARQMPNFAEFCSQRTESYTAELGSMLEPLVKPSEDKTRMLDSLRAIVSEAQHIGIDLYSCPYDARYHFPEFKETYDPTVMVNLDPALHAHFVKGRVTVSVTPYIRVGFNHSEPARVRNVCNAKVFTGLPLEKASFIAIFARRYSYQRIPCNVTNRGTHSASRRYFHDYFVTHLPSSSLHPDSHGPPSFHKLPRSASTPHTSESSQLSPASIQTPIGVSRDTTVVRIPLRSAKHHFGASVSRGSRTHNEDTYQAGVIEVPSFAKRSPLSLTIRRASGTESTAVTSGADSASGDPQVFYFGVFDGHGGSECSDFLRDHLHEYIQDSAADFEIQSTLKDNTASLERKRERRGRQDAVPLGLHRADLPIVQNANIKKIEQLETELVESWKNLVGGYFKRFRPAYFTCIKKDPTPRDLSQTLGSNQSRQNSVDGVSMEEVMEYAFLKADFDFVSAQAAKKEDDAVQSDQPLNADDILYSPSQSRREFIGGPKRFPGGSTCSVAMVSTPTPTPFWNPATPSSLLVSHVGDTRVLLCDTSTGAAIPVTTDHHPSSPIEANRLRRYAATFVTDSFGEERVSGLANTRAFGDIHSKRIGVSAEPEIRRIEMAPAEFSFLVLMSDGISGTLHDQEIVDIIKEARTPEQGARDVVNFATETSKDADNATCLVVRLGGWERRLEGGLGSMGTKEARDFRRQEATDPRRSRT